MSKSVYFYQNCPTCGRPLRIEVRYLGQQVVCKHCGADFKASDQSKTAASSMNRTTDLTQRAAELLDSVEIQRNKANPTLRFH